MKYTVKNKDGELTYGSMEELKQAYVLGLVEAEDEILEEGAQLWRKANGIPLLVTARKVNLESADSKRLGGWVFAALGLSVVSFYFLWNQIWTWGGLTTFGVLAMLTQIVRLTARPRR